MYCIYDPVLLYWVQKYPKVNHWEAWCWIDTAYSFGCMENKDLNCIVITVAFSYSSAPTVRLSWKYRERVILNHSAFTHIHTHRHTYTRSTSARLPAIENSKCGGCEPTGKQGLREGKESTTNAKGGMVLQRFRGRTNRYTRTHNTPTQPLNNAGSLSCLLPLWPLSSLHTVWKSLFLFCRITEF